MTNTELTIAIVSAAILGGASAYFLIKQHREAQIVEPTTPVTFSPNQERMLPLKIQAHERVSLLVERISFPALFNRIQHQQQTVATFSQVVSTTILEEYQHNVSQQIYLSDTVWHAVTSYKDQQLLIIKEVAQLLQPGAPALALMQGIESLLQQGENTNLLPTVQQAIRHEARQLLQ